MTDLDGRQWVLNYDLLVSRTISWTSEIDVTQTKATLDRYPFGQPESIESNSYGFFTRMLDDGMVAVESDYFDINNFPDPDPPPGGPSPAMSGGGSVSYSYTPARVVPYNLESGTEFTQDYRVQKKYLIMTPPDEAQVQSTIRFYGKEPVAVPAGIFETCRFSETRMEERFPPNEPSVSVIVNTKSWIGVGNGLLIRYERDGEVYELIEASIDGEPVTGR